MANEVNVLKFGSTEYIVEDPNALHKTGNETASGTKTFSDGIVTNQISSESSMNIETESTLNLSGGGETASLNSNGFETYTVIVENLYSADDDYIEVNDPLRMNANVCSDDGYDFYVSSDDGCVNICAPAFSSSASYAVGQYVSYGTTSYNRKLYKCTTAHSGAWNASHFTRCVNMIYTVGDIVANTLEATGSDYAEKFEVLEYCPACRFVTLDGEKIRLAQPGDDYILGITSEHPSILGDNQNTGVPVGMLGKLWVEHDGSAKVNGYVTAGLNGIATNSDKGYRVMAVDGNRCKVLVK